MNETIERAKAGGIKTLDEFESKKLLRSYGIPTVKERPVATSDECAAACAELGFPVVIKALSSKISHKTERNLVRVGVPNPEAARKAFNEIKAACGAEFESVIVQQMVSGRRELVAGLTTDAQFGPCVMFGLGGIFTEVLKDVAFRVAPITVDDAMEMMNEIKAKAILGAVRGMPPADRDALAAILVSLGKIGMENPEVREIDINPIMLEGESPVAVDALVVLK